MNEGAKEKLLAQFSDYLDQDAEIQLPPDPAESVDQFSLFAELSALKTQSKQQSREVRGAVEEFKAVFQTLQTSHDLLAKELERRKEQEQQQRQAILRPLLEQLLDLYDRLLAGSQSTARLPSRWFGRQRRRQQALHDGQAMTLARLRDILATCHVTPMQCVGRVLDPHSMHAVEIEHRPNATDGIVVAECRTGFVWEGAVLRPAQVKVNKLSSTNHSSTNQ